MRPKTDAADAAMDEELYREALEQLKSISIQVKSPGEYVVARLESVALDDIRRELNALLGACQSTASELLKSLFASATPFNENIESTIQSVAPFKDMLEESVRELEGGRSAIKQTKRQVKLRMCRYVMVAYAKMALATHLEATKHLDNIAEEIIDSFLGREGDASRVEWTVVQRAIAAVENIARHMENAERFVKSRNGRHARSKNWALFEIVPREIKRVQKLLSRCRHYEAAITEYLAYYATTLREADPEQYKSEASTLRDDKRPNVEKVLEMEGVLELTELEQFRGEYAIEKAERGAAGLRGSLVKLSEACAQIAMADLFALYTERAKLSAEGEAQQGAVESLSNEIATYVAGLSSLIKGAEQLRRIPGCEGKAEASGSMPFVLMFNTSFVRPILNSIAGALIQSEGGYASTSPQEEAHKFSNFVDMAIDRLLHPRRSVAMQLLNDVTKAGGSEAFKVVCVFDAIAAELLGHIEKHFAAIYFPIYMDRFIRNLRAYDRLIESVETAGGSYAHYLRWRGSKAPNNASRCFSVGVVCDNFIEDTAYELAADIASHGEITGKLHEAGGKAFYLSPSMTLHRQLLVLLNHRHFFYHLMPQYLRGASEMFGEYVKHLQGLVARMGDGGTGADAKSGEAVTHAAYMLHDLDAIERDLSTGSAGALEIGIAMRPGEFRESDYGAVITPGDCEWNGDEAERSAASPPSASTSSGGTSSTHVSGLTNTPSSVSPCEDGSPDATPKRGLSTEAPGGMRDMVITLVGKADGDIVRAAVRLLEYPLQVAFKRVSCSLASADGDRSLQVPVARRARDVLEVLWKNADRQPGVNQGQTEGDSVVGIMNSDVQRLPSGELADLRALINFAKTSVQALYNFFNSAHEQVDTIKYTLEDLVIQRLVAGATCSLQFLQSMPSKFRAATRQEVSKPSSYVKYMLVPLVSFKEFAAPSVPRELGRKIMTQTVARLSAEYRAQVTKLLQTVENLNRSLLSSSSARVKEQGANYLVADLEQIRAQLATDIAEFVGQCSTRLEIEQEQCEDLRRLSVCIE
ncbi:conserved oligomeric Golgi complex subunit 2 [Babesia caballi]|uniref:Conserved oligomeric Golgi complex subunit 2 n=1 Tax=Babesia caballi TaxID=5871 RepID=A0AAV4M5Z3_BABCB|nr:conserved oligomeric Golgi complex subunit 2 [Babesia caballi]